MKLLVTGGCGFIGSNFIRYWFANHPQDSIINLDKLTYAGNLENLKAIEANPGYHFIKGDICDEVLISESMKGIDAVIHFAAQSHVDRSILGPKEFVRTNVLGTQVLLDAALKNKVKRFHHVSTDEVFGTLVKGSTNKFNENSCFAPNSPYAASKAGADCLVRAYYKTYNLAITITNTSNNFGPFQFPEKLISLAITNLLENKKVPVYGDGGQVRDWLYVEDHCRGIDLVLQKGKIGQTYCIGGLTEDITNLEVIKKICTILGKGEDSIEFVKDRPGHDVRYSLDWSKSLNELGYQPKFDFDTYLANTVNWYKDNEDWWRKIKTGEYLNYYKEWYGK